MVVEFDAERLENAKQRAAKRISGKVNIPGFRKGKAPYRVIVKYIGEPAIVEEAVELITNDVYKEALDQTTLKPYGPGALEDYAVDPAPRFTFSVPLEPTIDLKDYRSVRVEWEPAAVEDEAVDRVLKSLQMEQAVVEDSQRPAALGDRVTLDIHSHIEPVEGDDDAEEVEYIHEHDGQFLLDDKDDVAPGFSAALVGSNPGDSKSFELTLAEDDKEYPGRTVHFAVTVKKVENVTLPVLNDDLIARVTKDEEKPLTLLEMRVRVRENLQRSLEENAKNEYAEKALNAMLDQAEIAYPEAMVADQVQRLLERFDEQLRRNKLTLQDYMRIYRRSIEELYQQYKPTAERIIRRGLVLREVGLAEGIEVSDDDMATRIDELVGTVSETERDQARQLFANAIMRDSMREDMTRDKVMERIVAIARGEAPELPVSPAAAQTSESEAE